MAGTTTLLSSPTTEEPQVCDSELSWNPWDTKESGYGPGASHSDPYPSSAPVQQLIPQRYRSASSEQLADMIGAAKRTLGEDCVILGHFYQRDEIVRWADFLGDSYKLAKAAQTREKAKYIVFCGVHFMAETADILSRPDQSVILPNLSAGCSMADMANSPDVSHAWKDIQKVVGTGDGGSQQGMAECIPVTYMNSSAALKDFCGRNGGIVCTSSNARAVLEWAFSKGKRVLFFPDQHLGRNTATEMGIPTDQMIVWSPAKTLGGNTEDSIRNAKMILWNGFCSVHHRFKVSQIEKARQKDPNVRVLVHPECTLDVVQAADASGSTDFICKQVAAAAPGTSFAIGTEINLVSRLARQHPDLTISCLDPVVCPCSTMYRIHPAYLAWVLESLVKGEVPNQIHVDPEVAKGAHIALQRMLDVAK